MSFSWIRGFVVSLAVPLIACFPSNSAFAQEDPDEEAKRAERAQEIAVEFAKGSMSEEEFASAGIDAAIGVVALGFPPAGPILSGLKDLFLSKPSPEEAIDELGDRLARAERNISQLSENFNQLAVAFEKERNIQRITAIQLRGLDIGRITDELANIPNMSPQEERRLVNDALRIADHFLPADIARRNLWLWDDMIVEGDPDTKTVRVYSPDEPTFELNLQLPEYLHVLAVLVTAINATGAGISDEAKRRHIAFLTRNPTDFDGQPMTGRQDASEYRWPVPLPEVAFPVHCTSLISSPFPDAQGRCYWTMRCEGLLPAEFAKVQTQPYQNAGVGLCTLPAGQPFSSFEASLREQALAEGGGGLLGETLLAAARALEKAGEIPHDLSSGVVGGSGFLFAATQAGRLDMFYDRVVQTPGRITHELQFVREIPGDWHRYKQVMPVDYWRDDMFLFGLTHDGNLEHIALRDWKKDTVRVETADAPVGNGWNGFSTLFSTGKGVIYGVQPNGDLIWNRHQRPWVLNSGYDWAKTNKVGTGWGNFKKVFSTSEGVIYALEEDGDLKWYRHTSYKTGEGIDQPGRHWQQSRSKVADLSRCEDIVPSSEGAMFCITPHGELRAFNHKDWGVGVAGFNPTFELETDWPNYEYLFGDSGAPEFVLP